MAQDYQPMPEPTDEPDRWRLTLRMPAFAGMAGVVGWPALALEAAAFLLVLAMAVAVRVVKLGTIPRIVTADELDNLQTAYHIMAGTGPGFFSFDWKPAPIFSMYQLAWTMRIFGSTISDFRLFPVILSMLTIIIFYFAARRAMSPFAALAGMALLSTNLMFLHFSRTAWENTNAALFAMGALYATQRALVERRGGPWAGWWALCGVFVALGLYGYFTGRFIFVAVIAIAALAVVLRQQPWRPTFAGLVLAGLVSTVLFAPMAHKIVNNWDYFNRRTTNVSVFSVRKDQPYEGDTNGWVIAAKNVVRNYQAFVLQDGSQVERGLWTRYNPLHRAPLDFISAHLFWGALIVGVIRWRKTYAWWTFFAPLFIAEVFSTGTPDLARGVIFAPFYFLFIGLLFDEALKLFRAPFSRWMAGIAIVWLVAFIGTANVTDYFQWQNKTGAQVSRLPGVDPCEFALWHGMAIEAANKGNGTLVDIDKFEAARKDLDCSGITVPKPAEAPAAR